MNFLVEIPWKCVNISRRMFTHFHHKTQLWRNIHPAIKIIVIAILSPCAKEFKKANENFYLTLTACLALQRSAWRADPVPQATWVRAAGKEGSLKTIASEVGWEVIIFYKQSTPEISLFASNVAKKLMTILWICFMNKMVVNKRSFFQ